MVFNKRNLNVHKNVKSFLCFLTLITSPWKKQKQNLINEKILNILYFRQFVFKYKYKNYLKTLFQYYRCQLNIFHS